tara:strand:- start:159 stop:392 length:234 start_codon:yes stop_codon:yes gene_type:complete
VAVNKKGVLKSVAKKVATKVIRRAGPLAVASTLYDFYKSGQKNSGGKAVKGQKSFMKNSLKKTGRLVKNRKSIYKKK